MLKIRRPLGRLIFNMGIAIPGETVFLIETAPSTIACKQLTVCESHAKSIILTMSQYHRSYSLFISRGRHQMETFYALLALCEGNTPVIGGFPSRRPVTRSFDVFFDLRLNKWLSKLSRRRWFETPSRSLWRHCYAIKQSSSSIGLIKLWIDLCMVSPLVLWFSLEDPPFRVFSQSDVTSRHTVAPVSISSEYMSSE